MLFVIVWHDFLAALVKKMCALFRLTQYLGVVNIYVHNRLYTVCPGSSDPPEKTLNIFASENEVYTIF